MPVTPPDRIPTWATDGGADVTDPGTSKQATGWIEGEAPAADHTNWLANGVGGYVDFFQDALAPYIAHSNVVRTATQPWGTSSVNQHVSQYLPGLDRYYAAEHDGTNLKCWDSADGITWSGATTVVATGGVSVPQMADDGTNLYILEGDTLYRSTTGLVTNFAFFGTLPASAYGVVYDKVNDYFIAGGIGLIWYSTTGLTSSWSSYTTPVNNCIFTAHNTVSGRTVCYEDTAFDFYYSDNATTWNQEALVTEIDNLIFSEALEAFVARRTSDGLLMISDGDDVSSWSVTTGIVADVCITTPEFLLVEDDTSTLSNWYALKGLSGADGNITVISLGHSQGSTETESQVQMSAGGWVVGGGGTYTFPYGTDYLAYSQYKARG